VASAARRAEARAVVAGLAEAAKVAVEAVAVEAQQASHRVLWKP